MRIGDTLRCNGCGKEIWCPRGEGDLPGDWHCWRAEEDDIADIDRLHVCSKACMDRVGDGPRRVTVRERMAEQAKERKEVCRDE